MDTDPKPEFSFDDPQFVARYADNPPRFVPGFDDMQRMARLLLAERVSEQARVLVVGAGGGLELKKFAESHPQWTFDGVDPSPHMLQLARQTLGSLASRVQFHEGLVESAPLGPFDAASCLLTLHFLDLEQRRLTLSEIRRRLKPGAPFVMAHLSVSQDPQERKTWLSRYVAFAVSSGVVISDAEFALSAIEQKLHILAPEQEESMLRSVGFNKIDLFYTGFAFRGWVALA